MLRLQKIEDLYIFGVWKPVKDANNAAATILKEFCKQASIFSCLQLQKHNVCV